MNDLPAHEGPRVAALIEGFVAGILSLPPHGHDLNPVGNVLAKLSALPRKAVERNVVVSWVAIDRLVDLVTPDECASTFAATGCDAA